MSEQKGERSKTCMAAPVGRMQDWTLASFLTTCRFGRHDILKGTHKETNAKSSEGGRGASLVNAQVFRIICWERRYFIPAFFTPRCPAAPRDKSQLECHPGDLLMEIRYFLRSHSSSGASRSGLTTLSYSLATRAGKRASSGRKLGIPRVAISGAAEAW